MTGTDDTTDGTTPDLAVLDTGHRETLTDVENLLFASVQSAFGALNETQHALIWEALTKVRSVLHPSAGYHSTGSVCHDFQVVGPWGVDGAIDAEQGFRIIDNHDRAYPERAGECRVERIDAITFNDGSQYVAAPVLVDRPQ